SNPFCFLSESVRCLLQVSLIMGVDISGTSSFRTAPQAADNSSYRRKQSGLSGGRTVDPIRYLAPPRPVWSRGVARSPINCSLNVPTNSDAASRATSLKADAEAAALREIITVGDPILRSWHSKKATSPPARRALRSVTNPTP